MSEYCTGMSSSKCDSAYGIEDSPHYVLHQRGLPQHTRDQLTENPEAQSIVILYHVSVVRCLDSKAWRDDGTKTSIE